MVEAKRFGPDHARRYLKTISDDLKQLQRQAEAFRATLGVLKAVDSGLDQMAYIKTLLMRLGQDIREVANRVEHIPDAVATLKHSHRDDGEENT